MAVCLMTECAGENSRRFKKMEAVHRQEGLSELSSMMQGFFFIGLATPCRKNRKQVKRYETSGVETSSHWEKKKQLRNQMFKRLIVPLRRRI